ncbi:MAG: HD domain-containing protein [Actinomycetia bacterium]|nr:HD domain-containing protein [Actinomycetes bacterium]
MSEDRIKKQFAEATAKGGKTVKRHRPQPPLGIRDRIHRQQAETALSPAATRSADSRGRYLPEPDDDLLTPFQVDRDRLLFSKAFRRLRNKTQVFPDPPGDHVITRLTHTIHVAQIGRSLAVALGLNESLAEAICLGHDIGHSPFGHVGEEALSPYVQEGDWHHAAHGVRLLNTLEPLNLTFETLDGVRAHTWRIDPGPSTPEGMLCRFADRIAYLTHDLDDAFRHNALSRREIPAAMVERFGEPQQWVSAMGRAVVDQSARSGKVSMDPEALSVMTEFRTMMFERVYESPQRIKEHKWAVAVITRLVEHFIRNPEDLPSDFGLESDPPQVRAVDYVAGFTDRAAMSAYQRLFGDIPGLPG